MFLNANDSSFNGLAVHKINKTYRNNITLTFPAGQMSRHSSFSGQVSKMAALAVILVTGDMNETDPSASEIPATFS